MNAKKFSDAMSELDTKYVDEALNYKKKAKKPIWVKWGTIAACLCLMIPLTAFAVDIIQYNAAVDYLRHLQVEDKYKFLMAEAMISISDIDEEIDEQVYAKVNLAIESLPEQCRLIIKLNVLEGKKYQEIAEELGITVNTIRTQVSRGYKKLRDILSGVVDSSVLFFIFLKNR